MPASAPELRLGFAFTARDGPALRARVAGDLARIAEATRRADPALRSLLLVGGYSRGEGSARDGAPVNDYDLVAVRGAPRPPAGLYDRLADRLGAEVGIAVDLAPVWAARLPVVPRTIFWYEAREAGRTILGPDARPSIRRVSAESLPVEEAVRLLFNRAAGLVVAADPQPDPFLVTLQAAKARLACAEALLVARRAYHWSARERARRLADLPLPAGLDHLPKEVERATAWKLGRAEAEPDADELWDDAREDLLAVLAFVLGGVGASLPRLLRRDGWRARLAHLALARRALRAPTATQRAAGLELLAACDRARPRPAADLSRARRFLAAFGPVPADAGFRDLKTRFLAAREVTLH